jgi:hypothetical protein
MRFAMVSGFSAVQRRQYPDPVDLLILSVTVPEAPGDVVEVISKTGLAPVTQQQFQQILLLQGCLFRF